MPNASPRGARFLVGGLLSCALPATAAAELPLGALHSHCGAVPRADVLDARGPMLHPKLPKAVAALLERALPVGRDRLRDRGSCRDLFTELGSDGIAELDDASYYPAGAAQERRYCGRYTHAVTTIGDQDVVLCRSFAGLSHREAAVILLHEALHSAGQTEYPVDADAPDSMRITRTVMRRCGLS